MGWWVAIRGAEKYIRGEREDLETQKKRIEICAACPDAKAYKIPVVGHYVTCGDFATETEKTCGCLVAAEERGYYAVTMFGLPMLPAGKTTIKGESCPQGKW